MNSVTTAKRIFPARCGRSAILRLFVGRSVFVGPRARVVKCPRAKRCARRPAPRSPSDADRCSLRRARRRSRSSPAPRKQVRRASEVTSSSTAPGPAIRRPSTRRCRRKRARVSSTSAASSTRALPGRPASSPRSVCRRASEACSSGATPPTMRSPRARSTSSIAGSRSRSTTTRRSSARTTSTRCGSSRRGARRAELAPWTGDAASGRTRGRRRALRREDRAQGQGAARWLVVERDFHGRPGTVPCRERPRCRPRPRRRTPRAPRDALRCSRSAPSSRWC